MKSLETIRFACGDCHVVFDLCLAPFSECADGDLADIDDSEDPTVCPFCGAGEIKPTHTRPTFVPT
jgi:ribosomal protein S27AE